MTMDDSNSEKIASTTLTVDVNNFFYLEGVVKDGFTYLDRGPSHIICNIINYRVH